MKFFNRFKFLLRRKPKPYLLDNTYRIIPAFEWEGQTFFMFEDPLNVTTGRGLHAMAQYESLVMRCGVDYLKAHIEATEKIFNDPKKINLPLLMKLNINLKERVNLLIALPDQVYKLASVVFFTKEESPYRYDPVYNQKKIKSWQEAPDMFDFFMQTPLPTLIPFLQLPKENSQNYLQVAERINQMHLRDLSEILSKKI